MSEEDRTSQVYSLPPLFWETHGVGRQRCRWVPGDSAQMKTCPNYRGYQGTYGWISSGPEFPAVMDPIYIANCGDVSSREWLDGNDYWTLWIPFCSSSCCFKLLPLLLLRHPKPGTTLKGAKLPSPVQMELGSIQLYFITYYILYFLKEWFLNMAR